MAATDALAVNLHSQDQDGEFASEGVNHRGGSLASSVSSVATVYDEPSADDSTVLHMDPVASVQTTAINIISNVVGAGILGIPGAFAGMSVIPAVFMLTLFAVMSGWSMVLLTLCAQRTGRFTYKDLIEYATGSSLYARLFDGAIFVYTFSCCIAYAHGVGDAMSPVMRTIIGHDNFFTSPGAWILLAALIFFPLSSFKQLAELKLSSLFGFLVIIYMVFVIVLYFFTHKPENSETLVNPSTPWFSLTLNFIKDLPMCSVGFSCHYNIPVFYGEMRRRTPNRMVRAVTLALPCIYFLYILTSMFSVMHVDPKQLMKKGDVSSNYPDNYMPMVVARVGLFIHFVCVFPIICIAARRSMNSILFNRGNMPHKVYVVEAFGLVVVSCLLAWLAKSVLQIFDIAGALFGIAIVVVIPNVLYLMIVPGNDSAEFIEDAHAGVDDDGDQKAAPATRSSDNRRRASSMHSTGSARRRSSSVHRHPWLDDLVAFRPRWVTLLGRFLIALGLVLSIFSFVLNLYETVHPSSDDSSTPSGSPNTTNTTGMPSPRPTSP